MTNIDAENQEKLLQEIILAYQNQDSDAGAFYFGKMHLLAEQEHLLAKQFFIDCLDSDRPDWREYCLMALGHHYDLTNEEDVIKKIAEMALSDSKDYVRLTATYILGYYPKLGRDIFIKLLNEDDDEYIKMSAFFHLLLIAGVSWYEVRKIENDFGEEKKLISMAKLTEILNEKGFSI